MNKGNKSKYKPINPKKYVGDANNITCRSDWERKVCRWADTTKDVLLWSSEEKIIWYKHPIDGKPHRYFPDFWMKMRTKTGEIKEYIVEVKPFVQTQEPKKRNKITKRFIKEVETYAINMYKWSAAEAYCAKNGYEFIILTERELNIKY